MRLFSSLLLAGIGAGAMYLLDPNSGRRRRALVRDKAVHLSRKVQCAADAVGKDLANRIEGMKHEGPSLEKLGLYKENWSPAARFFVSLVGAALSLYGMSRHDNAGRLLLLAATGLIAEGVTNAHLAPHHNGNPEARKEAQPNPATSRV
jgi:hypothetical protein